MIRWIAVFLLLPMSLNAKTLTFVGDIVLGQDDRYTGKTFDWQYSINELTPYFTGVESHYVDDSVRSLLRQSITVGNFEGTLFSGDLKRADKKFAFRGKPEYAKILRNIGVDIVNLANNHAPFDYGKEGLERTKVILKAYGIETYGNDTIWDSHQILPLQKGKEGICICGLEAWHSGIKKRIKKNLEELKARCKFLVYTFHWGHERHYKPAKYQRRLAHWLLVEGVDLVVGHHPHVIQTIEQYKGKYIVYSLGNFIFGGNKNPSDKEAIIFEIDTKTSRANVYKVLTSSLTYRNDYKVVLMEQK